MKKRLAICAAIILAGLSLRAFGLALGLPAVVVKYGGSILWAAMVYFLVALSRGDRSRWRIAAAAMWKPSLDATLPGALLLGRIFSPWDILAYAIGVALTTACDPGRDRTRNRSRRARSWPLVAQLPRSGRRSRNSDP